MAAASTSNVRAAFSHDVAARLSETSLHLLKDERRQDWIGTPLTAGHERPIMRPEEPSKASDGCPVA